MVLKYSQFINEAKKDKTASVELLIKLLTEKPSVKTESGTQKDAYSLEGIKKYFNENGLTNSDADEAMYQIHNLKEYKSKYKKETFDIKSFRLNKTIPFHHIGLTDKRVAEIKEKTEKQSKELAKPELEKREATKKRLLTAAKEKEDKKAERKTTERKTPSKRVAKK